MDCAPREIYMMWQCWSLSALCRSLSFLTQALCDHRNFSYAYCNACCSTRLLPLVSIVHGAKLAFWLVCRWYQNPWSKNCIIIIIIIFIVIAYMLVTCPLALSMNQKL